jgi:hypothetical protein
MRNCAGGFFLKVTGRPELPVWPTPEGQWIEMTSPKLLFNSEADTFTKYQSSGKIKHNG